VVRRGGEVHNVKYMYIEMGRDWPGGEKAAGNSAPQSIVIV